MSFSFAKIKPKKVPITTASNTRRELDDCLVGTFEKVENRFDKILVEFYKSLKLRIIFYKIKIII
jgi:hypothetical protein